MRQRLSPSWKQDWWLCSSHTPYQYYTHIRKPTRQHLTKVNTKYKQSEIKTNCRTSMDTCTYRHTWKRGGRSTGKRRKQEAAAKIKTKLSKKAHQKQEIADYQHRNGGYNPQQDSPRLPWYPAKNRPLETT